VALGAVRRPLEQADALDHDGRDQVLLRRERPSRARRPARRVRGRYAAVLRSPHVAPLLTASMLAWPVTAMIAGFAIGTATGGALVETVDWQACFVAAALAGALGATIAYRGRRTLAGQTVVATA
jgi:hypothetical protein